MTDGDGRDERLARGLDRFWDQVVGGNPAAPADLDPDLAAVVRALEARSRRATPDPAFVADLELHLTGEIGPPTETVRSSNLPPTPNGRAFFAHAGGLAVPGSSSPRRRWRAHLGTAALILVMLVSGYITVVWTHSRSAQPGWVPAVVASPPASDSPAVEEPESTTLAVTSLPGLVASSGGVRDFALWHATIEPGVQVVKSPEYGDCCPAPVLYHILAGELSVRVDGPLQVMPAAADGVRATPTVLELDSEAVLRPGDTALWAFDSAAELTNIGRTPVRFLAGGYFPGTLPDAPEGYAIDTVGETYPAPVLPVGPVSLTLQRTRLDPDAVLAPPPSEALREVVSGPEQGMLAEGSDGSLRNLGRDAVVLHSLTVAPIRDQASTPAAASQRAERVLQGG